MSEHSISSQRAWQLCDISLRRIAADMGIQCRRYALSFRLQTRVYFHARSSSLLFTGISACLTRALGVNSGRPLPGFP